MSKHGKKKGRKPRPRKIILSPVLCPGCLKTSPADPGYALGTLTASLNMLADIGLKVVVHKGFISAEGERGGGFILPPLNGSGWTTNMVTYSPAASHLARHEDDLDS